MQIPTAARSAHVDTFTRDALPPRSTWPDLQIDHPDVQYGTHVNCAAELLDATAMRVGADRPCLIDGSAAVWSYGQLLRSANQFARVLVEDLDLLPGQRVLLRGPNSPMLVACWLAVVNAGGVVDTTTTLLQHPELQTIS